MIIWQLICLIGYSKFSFKLFFYLTTEALQLQDKKI